MSDTYSLRDLGWSPFFQSGVDPDELAAAEPVRVAAVHRTGLDVIGAGGPRRVGTLPEVAVGDWLLVGRGDGGNDGRPLRVLERKSLVARHGAGAQQLVAANLDALFVVTSCNADFNLARLERYLAVARQGGVTPLVVLTKADAVDDPGPWIDRARALGASVPVEAVNALDPASVARLAGWCGPGATVALAGMSGVGKSTLANTLTGATTGAGQATAAIREDDARGRHTTTVRSLLRTVGGGWLIDTPGMRALGLAEAAEGIEAVFDDVTDLAAGCRFRDCRHEGEPGCAVAAAVAAGTLDAGRVARWRKLVREDARNGAALADARTRVEAQARERAKWRLYREAKQVAKDRRR